MVKVIAYTALMYGKPYLSSAIRSVINAVDEYYVLFTPIGSHGYRSRSLCPDTRDELLGIAIQEAGSKLRWREGVWHSEGLQRDSIFDHAPDADVIVVLDSDEIWQPEQLERLIQYAAKSDARNILSYEMPFWRSFWRAIPDRLCAPVRAINRRNSNGSSVSDTFFAHMGYCQPTRYIEHKMTIHGHRADWRQEWFVEKWLTNAQEDVHPTNVNFWNARPVYPLDYLPAWMHSHPFYKHGVIE